MGCATRSRNDRETAQWYEKGKCGSERRCGTEGVPKRGRDAHPALGGDKEGGEGTEGMGEREREAKETKEKETGIDSLPWYEARRNNMRRRTASTRSRIGVAGAVPTSLLRHSGAPMAAWGTPISPTAMATSCDNGVRYSPSLKIYSNPESLFSRSSCLFFASQAQASLALIRNVSFPLEGVRIDYEKMGKSRWPLLCDVKSEHVLALRMANAKEQLTLIRGYSPGLKFLR